MLTVLDIIQKTTGFFETRGVEHARLDAELLVGRVLALPRMQLYMQFERPLTEPELEQLRPLVRRRGQHEPLAYILGEVEFFHLRLKVDRRALIPRPETEHLCELITQRLAAAPPAAILDLGTGCGAIALGLAAFYADALVTAVDVSADALALAGENAGLLGLAGRTRLLRSDWFAALEPGVRFDLIVANPPYLSDQETAAAPPEVREHEPRVALSSGVDGLDALNRIIAEAPRFLAEHGLLALETGVDQQGALAARAAAAGLPRVELLRDLSGRDRYLLAWRS